MNVYKNLYVSQELQNHQEELIKNIQEKKTLFNIYIIVLAQNEQNNLEIYNTALNIQHSFSTENVMIVGIAKGYHNALELVRTITQEIYETTHDTDIRGYFLK
ncbi:MAG: hypothetical protein RR275_04130 [Lachnospiraceae bacterium]